MMSGLKGFINKMTLILPYFYFLDSYVYRGGAEKHASDRPQVNVLGVGQGRDLI